MGGYDWLVGEVGGWVVVCVRWVGRLAGRGRSGEVGEPDGWVGGRWLYDWVGSAEEFYHQVGRRVGAWVGGRVV